MKLLEGCCGGLVPAGYDSGLGPPVLSTDDHSLPLAPQVRSATDTDQVTRASRVPNGKVTEAIVAELERQGVADAVADLGFDPMQMARAVIRALATLARPVTTRTRGYFGKAGRDSLQAPK